MQKQLSILAAAAFFAASVSAQCLVTAGGTPVTLAPTGFYPADDEGLSAPIALGFNFPMAGAASATFSHVVIEYVPQQWCVESKSLKLYLWGFRDRAVFAEALTAEIAAEIMATAQPHEVTVTLTQRPRGGIEVQAVAHLTR